MRVRLGVDASSQGHEYGFTMPGSILGTEVRRIEDPALITGQGTFVANLDVPGTLHAVFVRSPMAHAVIDGIDVSAAAAAEGVVAVFTAVDLGTDPVPQFGTASSHITRTALATDEVRFVGDPVAIVIAETRAAAVDASELVDVDYSDLPPVVGIESALSPDSPRAHPPLATNVAATRTVGDGEALAGADHVVRLRMENNRLATAPIEGHAILVHPRAHGDDTTEHALTVYVGTQQPHGSRDLIARLTGLDKAEIRVIAPNVGGGFGGKAGIAPDHCAVILAARLLGRPVLWAETRSESMLSMHGRGQVQFAELGLTSQGRITGLRATVLGDCGAYAGFGGGFPLGTTFIMAQGCYDIPRLDYTGVAVMTNTAPVGAFRGAGRPEAAAMLERLMDHAARELGLAPEDLRRINFLAPDAFPVATLTGLSYDTGDYDLTLDEALRLAGVDDLRAEQARRRERDDEKQIGIGIASYVEITGFGGSEYGHVEVHADGSATVMSGTSAHGQGHATAYAMLASEQLGIPVDQITYVQSDTALVRSGGGTGGSRSLQLGGNAVRQAAVELRERALDLAAQLLEADPADLEVVPGGFAVAGVPQSAVDWVRLSAYAQEREVSLRVDTDFTQTGATFPFGAHVAVVEVDTATGHVDIVRHVAVDDCGVVLNPLLVAGQQHGGLAQGISQALWEEFVYDDQGTPLTSSFADYPMPSAADLISFETVNTQTPTPLNPLGAKGIGESPTVGATPAVQNAVIDALAHLGVRHIDIPCTPARVFAALEAARRGEDTTWNPPPQIPAAADSGPIETVEI